MTATMDERQEGSTRRNFLYIGTGALHLLVWPPLSGRSSIR